MKKLFSLRNTIIFLATILTLFIISYLCIFKKEKDNIAAEIENWSLYQEITDMEDRFIGAGDCSNQEFNQFKALTYRGSMKKLLLPENLELVVTPNYYYWSNQKFLSFKNDDTAICAIMPREPLWAYADKLLWTDGCPTGGMIDPMETTGKEDFIKCLKSQAIVEDYFRSF